MVALFLARRPSLLSAVRKLHVTGLCLKNTRAGVVRRTRDLSVELTYEQAKKPHQIGVMKTWNSWNTANLEDEELYTSEITLQDEFIRMFIKGTFPVAVLSEIIIKRQCNTVRVAFLLSAIISTVKTYFLIGYTEEMLSAILRCAVKLEIQTVSSKKDVVFRRI
ncbi:unnamed protein product [Calicophoron daubneyi]|uniref:28S ribosomal protein S24, mitochondrial n=1 Tax=Calicophoron daubneyi TaxID=300641 RepID=A0AAV2T3L5_CALDB